MKGYQKETCLKEIGLHAQIMTIVIRSPPNLFGVGFGEEGGE